MSVGQAFLIAGILLGLACVSAVAVIVFARLSRTQVGARSALTLAPYRPALVAVASGEDEDGLAKASLSAVPAHIWVRLRPSVVAFLPKVRGVPAADLGAVMRAHGDVEEAVRMLVSSSAVARARAAYLLGLVRDPDSVEQMLPLMGDPSADVRMVTARALGAIGNPTAAAGVLGGLRTQHGRIGLPAWVAAEALLAMGAEIGPALLAGLDSADPAVRNVCAVVAGHGTFYLAAPRLRVLLAADADSDVRASAAVALGQVGGADDAATLARHTDACEGAGLRRTCATALGEMGRTESLDTLSGLLVDEDRRLAELAADSLVRIGPEGIARLQEAVAPRNQGPAALAAGGALELAALRGQLAISGTGP